MKKFSVILSLVAVSLVLTYCSSAKKAAASTAVAKTTFAGHLSTITSTNCTTCHIPSKGGNKKAFDNFTNVKTDRDEKIRRMELELAV